MGKFSKVWHWLSANIIFHRSLIDAQDFDPPQIALDDRVADQYSDFPAEDFAISSAHIQPPLLELLIPTPLSTCLAPPTSPNPAPISDSLTDLTLVSPIPTIHLTTDSAPVTYKFNTEDRYKCHCGFTPVGEEKWKASNLRRHKKTQHPPDIGKKPWKCQYPGCISEFTRSDNLRSHQKARSHALVTGIGLDRLKRKVEPEKDGGFGGRGRMAKKHKS